MGGCSLPAGGTRAFPETLWRPSQGSFFFLIRLPAWSTIIWQGRATPSTLRARIPRYAAKAWGLSPITRVPATIYDSNRAAVLGRYHLPEKFFYALEP